jgi:signal transduction histidine kinase
VLAVAIAVLLRLALANVIPLRSPFLLLFAAVMVSAVYGGLGPGILATLLVALVSDFFIIGFPLTWSRFQVHDPAQLGLFVAEGLFLSILGAMLHRARLRAELADAASRRLEQKILEISEGERRRIGHDLHDGLGQHLTGIALLAKALRQRLAGLRLPEAQQAERIAELVNESIGWTRDLARGLSPVTLECDGLPPALEELADNASSLLGITCTCTCDEGEFHLDGEAALHLYRIAQEAINNSVKHGRARNVTVGLRTEDGQVVMTVVDDGSGLSDKTRQHPGIGLQIMQYRARMIGATLSVKRVGLGGGTVVRCAIPAGATGAPAAPAAPAATETSASSPLPMPRDARAQHQESTS